MAGDPGNSSFNPLIVYGGVGLGKTFVGLMLLERLISYDRQRVVLLVPKGAREPVWEQEIKKYNKQLTKKEE